jgi:hypothetical protein
VRVFAPVVFLVVFLIRIWRIGSTSFVAACYDRRSAEYSSVR